MSIEREEGYEYRGWKLGEKVRYKLDNEEYTIIGFDETDTSTTFIAIDYDVDTRMVSKDFNTTSYLKGNNDFCIWVSERLIEK